MTEFGLRPATSVICLFAEAEESARHNAFDPKSKPNALACLSAYARIFWSLAPSTSIGEPVKSPVTTNR